MHKKTILITLLITIFTTAILTPQPTSALQITKVSATPITITGAAAEVGKNFTLTITVADVTDLWGYQFLLEYNTTILTALSYKNRANETYAPFDVPSPSAINDTEGWVSVSYSSFFGDSVGMTVSATDPKPLTDIIFRVDALGTTKLDLISENKDPPELDAVVLATVKGQPIRLAGNNIAVSDAFFSNTEVIQLHDVAITAVTPSTSTTNPGDTVGVDVTVSNPGNFNENVTVFIRYNTSAVDFKSIGTPKAIINLAPTESKTETFTWNTQGIPGGKYVIRAEATITQDDDPTNNQRISDIITIGTTGGTGYLTYIIIGVVIAVVAIGVYALRRRK